MLQLAQVRWVRGDRSSVRQLLREIDEVLPGRAKSPADVPRSPAELRHLPYLQTHLRLADIAQRLHLCSNTVASEVSAIYRKPGVSSRGQAVDRATVIGLLGP
ncbi:hypothetical protein AB0N29_07325 [Nocardioides sp. NPDC092400]|uniref:helix-turn-helix transcriptional regulator n=1 Tax=Nocardioides sp. NPDC092400 TaxID=3155196 RepID=UPI003444C9B8